MAVRHRNDAISHGEEDNENETEEHAVGNSSEY